MVVGWRLERVFTQHPSMGFDTAPCTSIDVVRSQSMSFSDYLRRIGFLEHIRDVLFLRGNTMYGLCAPHSNQLEPGDWVTSAHLPTRQEQLIYQQMIAWKDRLLQGTGCSISHIDAFLSGGPVPASRFRRPIWLTIFSDQGCHDGRDVM